MGKYDEAIARYNKAIDVCPKENTEDLATFYQNRAAAYEQLVIKLIILTMSRTNLILIDHLNQ